MVCRKNTTIQAWKFFHICLFSAFCQNCNFIFIINHFFRHANLLFLLDSCFNEYKWVLFRIVSVFGQVCIENLPDFSRFSYKLISLKCDAGKGVNVHIIIIIIIILVFSTWYLPSSYTLIRLQLERQQQRIPLSVYFLLIIVCMFILCQ